MACSGRSAAAEVRQHLELVTGSRLQVELIYGGVILRPASRSSDTLAIAEPTPMPAVAEPDQTAANAAAQKRGPGRPRTTMPQPLAPHRKIGGRKKPIPSDTDPA